MIENLELESLENILVDDGIYVIGSKTVTLNMQNVLKNSYIIYVSNSNLQEINKYCICHTLSNYVEDTIEDLMKLSTNDLSKLCTPVVNDIIVLTTDFIKNYFTKLTYTKTRKYI